MKTYTIDIHEHLKNVTFSVKNGKQFEKDIISGHYATHVIFICENDIKRVKKFGVKFANDKSSNKGKWYAHCNGYAMGLFISYNGIASINTYRPYSRTKI